MNVGITTVMPAPFTMHRSNTQPSSEETMFTLLMFLAPPVVAWSLVSYIIAWGVVSDKEHAMVLDHPFKPLWLRWVFFALAPITIPVTLLFVLYWELT
jgi:hypothetical protein